MPGIKALRKVQIGAETTAGTAVAATTIWRGEGTGQDTTEVVFPTEDVGMLTGTDRTYIGKVGGTIELTGVATYEQLPYVLEAGVELETPTQDGAGSDYIYVYNFPTTAQNTLRTYTIEAGDNQQAEEIAYCYVPSFSLSGDAGAAVELSSSWEGRQWSTTTYTGALSIPAVEEILASKGKLYIMPTSDGPTTDNIITGSLLSFSLDVTTGIMPYSTMDGDLFFTATKQTMPEVTLSVTFEHDANSVAQKALWRAETARRVYLIFTGSAVTTPGTTYSTKTLIIDLAGKWESFDALGETDGNDTISATFRMRYNSTVGYAGKITVVNELSALP